ncbi:MAG TPA: cytochrome P450 [Pseudonocardiaceae bacterium]|nr:cytochrome P450 [Pseudonocardiaceae bacterium]
MDPLTADTIRFVTNPSSQPVGDSTLFAGLATTKPLLRAGSVWIVSRHDLVSRLARHPHCILRMPDRWRASQPLNPAVSTFLEGLMPIQPPADHQRLRRLIAGQFSARSVAGLRGVVQAIVDELLTGPLQRGGCEIVGEVCVQLPVYTTTAMLGLPDSDRSLVLSWVRTVNDQVVDEVSGRIGGRIGGGVDGRAGASTADPGSGLADMIAYIEDLVRARTRRPGDDLISRLAAQSSAEDGRLSADELVSMVLMLLMTGIDTVGSGLSNVLLALSQHPDIWRQVVDDPRRCAAAYTEGLRLLPPLPMMGRIVEADIDLSGIIIPAGSTVLLMYGAANLDPAVFPRPLRFDLNRSGPAHLAFGHGPHFCLGAGLAVLQGERVLAALARHAPRFEVLDVGERRAEAAFHSPATMRMRLAPPLPAAQVPAAVGS